MDVVDFSEGIIGLDRVLPDGRQAREVVAKCLKREAENQDFGMAARMKIVATCLENGIRVNINVIRQIGERNLTQLRNLFLDS